MIYSEILSSLGRFWQRHPALLYGLSLFLGIDFALNGNYWIGFPAFLLFAPLLFFFHHLQLALRLLIALCVAMAGFFVVSERYERPQIPQAGIQGTATIAISSIRAQEDKGGKSWIYRGTVLNFFEKGALAAKNLPYILYFKENPQKERPLAQMIYQVQGRLKLSGSGQVVLKVTPSTPWIPLKSSSKWAEYRYWAKQQVQRYIFDNIHPLKTAKLLAGLMTGEFDDITLNEDFGRFGLLHLMAISGFHFSVIAAILNGFLRIFFNRQCAYIFLIAGLTAYCLFLGPAPSILRAWIMSLMLFGGYLVRRVSNGLNALGVALVIILCWDPFASQNLGFQFSFLITAAILIFAQESETLLTFLFPRRPLPQMLKMGMFSQHGYVLLGFFRQSLALLASVTLAALPAALYFFHTFPLLGMLYNLFFPVLITISMLFLVCGCLLFWMPPAAHLFHEMNQAYTSFLLKMLTGVPKTWDIALKSAEMAQEMLIVYLTLLFFIGILIKSEHYKTPV